MKKCNITNHQLIELKQADLGIDGCRNTQIFNPSTANVTFYTETSQFDWWGTLIINRLKGLKTCHNEEVIH